MVTAYTGRIKVFASWSRWRTTNHWIRRVQNLHWWRTMWWLLKILSARNSASISAASRATYWLLMCPSFLQASMSRVRIISYFLLQNALFLCNAALRKSPYFVSLLTGERGLSQLWSLQSHEIAPRDTWFSQQFRREYKLPLTLFLKRKESFATLPLGCENSLCHLGRTSEGFVTWQRWRRPGCKTVRGKDVWVESSGSKPPVGQVSPTIESYEASFSQFIVRFARFRTHRKAWNSSDAGLQLS